MRILRPTVALLRGVGLTHRLYRYYYPWNLWRSARMWPASGYRVDFGDREGPIDILLASDLHVTERGGETLEPVLEGDRCDSLTLLRAVIREHRPGFVLLTGDLTDTGSAAEWQRAAASIPGVYEVAVVPGNH